MKSNLRSIGSGAVGNTNLFILGLVIIAVAVGAVLRLWQYLANTSLWMDELKLAKGILDLDPWHLFISRLPYDQVAPKGFLLLEKAATLSLGTNEFALRLFPLLFSLISLAAFGRLAIRMLDGTGAVGATLLLATAAPMVAFGSLVKQYSADVCIAVLLWWLAYEVVSRPITARRSAMAAFFGAVLVWFSQPGVLMLASLGACLPFLTPGRSGRWRDKVLILACWSTSALAAAAVGLLSISAATREYLHLFWVGGFPPDSLSSEMETLWPLNELCQLFGLGQRTPATLAYPVPILYALLCLIGLVLLWFRNRKAAVLLIVPIIVTLGSAVLGQYPFSDRLIVFLVPAFMIAIGAAIDGVYGAFARLSKPLGVGIAAGLLAVGVYPIAMNPPPYRTEHIKPVLSYVQSRWQPNDSFYIYYGAAPAMAYYAARYGLARGDYVVGGCHRGDSRRYLQEIDTFRGRSRVWFLITHSIPHYREHEDILNYLDAIGVRKEQFVVASYALARTPRPAEVYLYDLSDAGKLATAAAASFRLTGPSSTLPAFECEAAAQAMVPSDFHE